MVGRSADGEELRTLASELVLFQDKGNHKREVVAAVRIQLHELSALAKMIERKTERFLKGKPTGPDA